MYLESLDDRNLGGPVHVIEVKRNLIDTVRSILAVRSSSRSPSSWWSALPTDCEGFVDAPATLQVVAQVLSLRRSLAAAKSELGPARWASVDYDRLASESNALHLLSDALADVGLEATERHRVRSELRFRRPERSNSPLLLTSIRTSTTVLAEQAPELSDFLTDQEAEEIGV